MGSPVLVFQTAKGTADRLSPKPPLSFGPADPAAAAVLVDDGPRFQTIEGFGGAFTEAAAVTFYRMPAAIRAEILRAYFDPFAGHGYTLCRTHINSCDFALGNYAYDDVAGDTELQHFSIEHDRQALLPMIQEALQLTGTALKLFASPWSPPAWMKTNGEMNHGGRLKPECQAAWARYYARYVQAYQKEGVPLWGLTVQNEPMATQTWDSCRYSAEEERDFVRDYLGPALAEAGLGRLRLMIWDHNRDGLYERAKTVYADPAAARYVWGAAFHWYVGDHFDNVQLTHDAFPQKQLLFSEGCQEGGPHYDEWEVGERYGHSMLQDLNRWTVGWVDWNLVLDQTGGPNHVGNLCSAPLLANTQTGQLYYHYSYDYIGHFARFIRPGAQRIACASTLDDLEATAFLNSDGRIAVVVLNRTDRPHPFELKYGGQAAGTISPAHSINTYCFAAG